MLPYVLEGSGKEFRTRGRARIIDFVLSSLPLSRLQHAKAMAELSDHEPIFSALRVPVQKLAKTIPDSTLTSHAIISYLKAERDEEPLDVWRKILQGGRIRP